MEYKRTRALVFAWVLVMSLVLVPVANSDVPQLPRVSPDLVPVSGPVVSSFKNLNAKLDTKLNIVVQAYAAKASDWRAAVDTAGLLVEKDTVLVEISFNEQTAASVHRDLEALGLRMRHDNAPGMYEAWLPIGALGAATKNPDVYFIRPARLIQYQEVNTGSSVTQGVVESNADDWQAAGYDGTGVTVALVDSFNASTISSLQASGDWPSGGQLTTVDVDGGGFGSLGSNHGMATMEILFDMAPGATFIAYEVLTVADWHTAVGLADAAGADIVSQSLGAPLDGIGDGSALPGSVAEAIAIARADDDILPVVAAGNERQQHWGGLYTPHATYPNSLDWGAGGNVNYGLYCIPNGYVISADLFWDDWTNVNHDHDLYLLEYNGSNWTQRALSANVQNGSPGQTPREWIRYTVSGALGQGGCPSGSGVFGVYVYRYSAATNHNLQVYTNLGELQVSVAARSLGFPADSSDVVSVAAIDVTSHVQESYSSEGPRLAAGGGLPTLHDAPLAGPEKPDLASFANVDTQSYGAGVFNGTSAATPHVAGMAALVKQAYPAYTATQIEQALIAVASDASNDLGTAGRDNQYGWGMARFLFVPTATDLLSFTAAPAGNGTSIVLEWETAAELDNLGFNLYRAQEIDGPRTQLNASLIPGQMPGTPAGAAYSWLDESVTTGITYYYWLEDVDVYGVATLHGPAAAALAPPLRQLPARPRPAPSRPGLSDH